MKIERFEDIRAWRLAKDLVMEVYRISSVGSFCLDAGLRNQIRRAAVSVMSNIAEGFERGSDKELRRFLYMAKGSAGEVRSQLYVARDLGYVTRDEFELLKEQAELVARALSGFISYLAHVGSA